MRREENQFDFNLDEEDEEDEEQHHSYKEEKRSVLVLKVEAHRYFTLYQVQTSMKPIFPASTVC